MRPWPRFATDLAVVVVPLDERPLEGALGEPVVVLEGWRTEDYLGVLVAPFPSC